jgi:CBS domain-containing protein
MLTVGKICSRDVDLASSDESVCQAANRMLARRVGTLVVLDAERRPIGIVTDRDLTLRVLATNKDPDTAWISEVFTTPVHTVTEDATIDEAVRKMRVERCRRLVVLNHAEHVVGIISLDDVLALLAEQLHNVAALLESEAPHALDGELQLGC